jgi:hypothetical protein
MFGVAPDLSQAEIQQSSNLHNTNGAVVKQQLAKGKPEPVELVPRKGGRGRGRGRK